MRANDDTKTHPLGLLESFGLHDPRALFTSLRRAVGLTPPVLAPAWGINSTRIFKPRISFPAWLGRESDSRRVPIYNFFNRRRKEWPTRYSVRTDDVEDFLGGKHTYDSHKGTDFACPVGTRLVAPAPGRVVDIANNFDQGGLQMYVDHGKGLMTGYHHLARTCAPVGAFVDRGELIALSGASGMDLVMFFPWVAPHVHFEVFMNGHAVDPYARVETPEVPLWRNGNDPSPHTEGAEPPFVPTRWDGAAVDASIAACLDASVRRELAAIDELALRACRLVIRRLNYPALFATFPELQAEAYPRTKTLDLPFEASRYVGAELPLT